MSRKTSFRPEALRPRLSAGLPLNTEPYVATRVLMQAQHAHRCLQWHSTRATGFRFLSVGVIRGMTTAARLIRSLAGNPAVPRAERSWTGGFASPPYDGFALVRAGVNYSGTVM